MIRLVKLSESFYYFWQLCKVEYLYSTIICMIYSQCYRV